MTGWLPCRAVRGQQCVSVCGASTGHRILRIRPATSRAPKSPRQSISNPRESEIPPWCLCRRRTQRPHKTSSCTAAVHRSIGKSGARIPQRAYLCGLLSLHRRPFPVSAAGIGSFQILQAARALWNSTVHPSALSVAMNFSVSDIYFTKNDIAIFEDLFVRLAEPNSITGPFEGRINRLSVNALLSHLRLAPESQSLVSLLDLCHNWPCRTVPPPLFTCRIDSGATCPRRRRITSFLSPLTDPFSFVALDCCLYEECRPF